MDAVIRKQLLNYIPRMGLNDLTDIATSGIDDTEIKVAAKSAVGKLLTTANGVVDQKQLELDAATAWRDEIQLAYDSIP